MDKNSLVGPFLSHSPSRVYRGDGAIRFSGEARYKYLHVDILYFLYSITSLVYGKGRKGNGVT